jgi:hypothetical protein
MYVHIHGRFGLGAFFWRNCWLEGPFANLSNLVFTHMARTVVGIHLSWRSPWRSFMAIEVAVRGDANISQFFWAVAPRGSASNPRGVAVNPIG